MELMGCVYASLCKPTLSCVELRDMCSNDRRVVPNLSWIAARDPGVWSTWYFG